MVEINGRLYMTSDVERQIIYKLKETSLNTFFFYLFFFFKLRIQGPRVYNINVSGFDKMLLRSFKFIVCYQNLKINKIK